MNPNNCTKEGQMSLIEQRSNGFRLKKLEVYNWGTFDSKIWVFTPNGETTLLTGESGSGKSTLVDALVTLFVAPQKTAYNKAADASARERTVASYVRGYYGQLYAYEGRGTPKALRDHKQYSVLIATLEDTLLHKTLSMAVFFWFREQQDKPQRFYTVAKRELFVAKDFSNFHGDVRQLKAALRASGCEIFDDFNHYSECFRKYLGDLSQQAVDLFQQTISMKKVEALTGFVRSNMLEETDINADIEELLTHYHSLNSAYEAVLRARKQAQLLEPICADGRQHASLQDELDEITRGRAAFQVWFAALKASLFTQRIQQLEQDEISARSTLESEQKCLEDIEAEIKRLDLDIDRNGGYALEQAQTELKQIEEQLVYLQKANTRYCALAAQLKLSQPTSSNIFAENFNQAAVQRDQLPNKKLLAEKNLSAVSAKLEKDIAVKQTTDDEITSLKQRTSNIPKDLIALRGRMCSALAISEAKLPFAGELIEVKDSELEWEGAIERLLHSFALSILVSERDYVAVSKWVNEQQLGARLVYFCARPRSGDLPSLHPDAVAHKLVIKQESFFAKWLIRELFERFPHICCSDLKVFRQEKRSITQSGQIKAYTRHEKDDRQMLHDRTRYVLGFSNQKKIEVLEQESAQLSVRISLTQAEQKTALGEHSVLTSQENALKALEDFADFSEIDVQSAEDARTACLQKIEELKRAENDILNILRKQLDGAKAKKSKCNDKLDAAKIVVSKTYEALRATRQDMQENHAILQSESPLEKLSYSYLEKNRDRWLGSTVLTLENSAKQEREYTKCLTDEREKVQKQISELKTSIEKGIVRFRQQFAEEARETDDTVESLPDFYRMQDQLLRDGLPKYEAQFKQRLTSQVLQQIALFQMTLKQQYSMVRSRIDAINKSMYGIDYNPSRYIKLNCEDNPDSEIKQFRAQLKTCTEGATGGFDDDDSAMNRFLEIKKIIERFQGREKETEADKRWTKKVTDVRNWFLFSASERWRETDEEYEHYTDSGGKSGGQKEKLAYTVLAASLLYNYKLHEQYVDSSSFRLVVIDEAFLRISDNATTYGLKLFEQLKFQLVIVTPLLKISTIEPFISHVGFVSHDDVAHKSSLVNIPIEVYKEKRKAWEDLHNG